MDSDNFGEGVHRIREICKGSVYPVLEALLLPVFKFTLLPLYCLLLKISYITHQSHSHSQLPFPCDLTSDREQYHSDTPVTRQVPQSLYLQTQINITTWNCSGMSRINTSYFSGKSPQSIGFFPCSFNSSLQREKWPHPKNPRCAESGEGCVDTSKWCRFWKEWRQKAQVKCQTSTSNESHPVSKNQTEDTQIQRTFNMTWM